MRSREFFNEAKKPKLTMPKQRDPNWQTMQAKGTSGASGRHQDKKKAAKQGQTKHKGRMDEGIADLEAQQEKLEYAFKQARKITTAIKYEDTVSEIITNIQKLAEDNGIADELKYPINDVYEAQAQLQSAVYGLDQVFEDALRQVRWKIDDLEESNIIENNEPDEAYLDKVISDLHKDVFGTRPDHEFGREWMSSSYEEKLRIFKNLLLNLRDD